MLSVNKVKIEKLTPGSILADDIVLNNGTTLLAKNTVLKKEDISKLDKMNILKVSVYDLYSGISISSATAAVVRQTLAEENIKPVRERVAFKQFSSIYEEEVDDIKNSFIAIGTGEAVEEDKLYNSAKSIMDKIYCKSDVVNYIHHLKESDDHTYRHCVNVALLCNLFANWAHLSETETKNVTLSGLLHDIGKTYIDQDVLNKPGRLSDDEFEEVKKHPLYGYKAITAQNMPQEVAIAVLMHHEKIDGSGYPLGADRTKISKLTKILTICDIYDAMTSDRCYHRKRCPFNVIKMFEDDCFGTLDTEYLLLFLRNIAVTFLNNDVLLSNGKKGKVVFINQKEPSKPIIKTDTDFIDLSKKRDILISEVL